jgi:hypothetical protein
MQSPAHFVVGAAICRYTRWRPLGLFAAFLSHFVLDALPHFEDPSILPRWLAPFAGRHWDLFLVGAQAVVLMLAVFVWLSFGGRDRRHTSVPYLIAGGFLACLPDYLPRLCGPVEPITSLNNWSHWLWTPPYLRALSAHGDWGPPVALACTAVELFVFVLGSWLLFRRSTPEGAGSGAPSNHCAEDTGNATDAPDVPAGEQDH